MEIMYGYFLYANSKSNLQRLKRINSIFNFKNFSGMLDSSESFDSSEDSSTASSGSSSSSKRHGVVQGTRSEVILDSIPVKYKVSHLFSIGFWIDFWRICFDGFFLCDRSSGLDGALQQRYFDMKFDLESMLNSEFRFFIRIWELTGEFLIDMRFFFGWQRHERGRGMGLEVFWYDIRSRTYFELQILVLLFENENLWANL